MCPCLMPGTLSEPSATVRPWGLQKVPKKMRRCGPTLSMPVVYASRSPSGTATPWYLPDPLDVAKPEPHLRFLHVLG